MRQKESRGSFSSRKHSYHQHENDDEVSYQNTLLQMLLLVMRQHGSWVNQNLGEYRYIFESLIEINRIYSFFI